MRLKYRKIILVITMSTMGIGLVTLSLSNTSNKKAEDKQTEETIEKKEKGKDTKEEISSDGSVKIADGLTDDGGLMENAYPEINALIKKFLDARVSSDIDTINSIVSKTNPITLSGLQKEAEYIEAYNNISCYTIKGPEKDSFIVYIYEEIKLVGIDTAAPGMTRVYVCKDENGNLIINFGQVEDEVNHYINGKDQDEEVISLIKNVNIKLEEAVTKDPALKEFTKKLGDTDTSTSKEEKAKSTQKKTNSSAKKGK